MEKKDLEKLTATKLREIAKQYDGITGAHAMKKEELIIAIQAARGDDLTRSDGGSLSEKIGAAKKKIKNLRSEKETVRETKDKKKVDILRRRIKKQRRMTRTISKAR